VQPGPSMCSTRPTVAGAFCRHGPCGMTWWVWTSKMNSPVPPRACSHAATSAGGGTVNVPPDVVGGGADGGADGDVRGAVGAPAPAELRVWPVEHDARLKTASDAATPPADSRKRRRSMPARAAAVSTSSWMRRRVVSTSAVGAAGTNSPLPTGPGGRGKGTASSRSLRRRGDITNPDGNRLSGVGGFAIARCGGRLAQTNGHAERVGAAHGPSRGLPFGGTQSDRRRHRVRQGMRATCSQR